MKKKSLRVEVPGSDVETCSLTTQGLMRLIIPTVAALGLGLQARTVCSANSQLWRKNKSCVPHLQCECSGFLLVSIKAYYVLVRRPFCGLRNNIYTRIYHLCCVLEQSEVLYLSSYYLSFAFRGSSIQMSHISWNS